MSRNGNKSLVISHKSCHGLTLIELVLGVAIIAVVAVLVISSYGRSVSNINLNSIAGTIVSNLKSTQAKAVSGRDNKEWGVCFENPSGGNPKYEIVSDSSISSNVTCTSTGATPSADINSTVFLPSGISFAAPSSGNATLVTFSKVTGATANATITISLSGATKDITVSASGLIY